MKEIFVTALLGLLCSGLRAQDNYIVFHPDTVYTSNIIRIYIDRAGNIYPPGTNVDTAKFPCICRKDPHYANLRYYFRDYDTITGHRVCEHYNVTNFDSLQSRLLATYADSVNKKLQGRKLVVLMHGFNDYATRGYDSIERSIERIEGLHRQLYLEVYWDGLKASSERFKDVSKIWFRANKVAPYIALTLRKLFAGVDDADMYIIAHSLGACVAARLLFNTHHRHSFALRKQWLSEPTPAQSRITLALLAPAIPGRRIFKHIGETVPPGGCHRYKKLIIGYNRHDYATTKRMRFPLSRMFYSTALGCNPIAVKRTGRVVGARCSLHFVPFDFSSCEDAGETHHMHQYARCDSFDSFITDIFN